MRPFLIDAMQVLGPVLVGLLTYYASEWLLKYRAWSDGLSPHIKRGVVLAIAGLITAAAKALNLELPTDLALWDPTTIDTVLSAGLAMAVKAGDTAKAAKSDAQDAKQAIG